MIRTSETVSALFAALVKAQAVMPSAAKDATGQVGQQRTKYADLPSVREAARQALTDNDLAFVQFPAAAEHGYVRVITRVVHKSGEWIEDEDGISVPTGNGTAQAVGSAMSYARRYSLMAALGIVADDDDDGHAATKAASGRQPSARPRNTDPAPQATGTITGPQKPKLGALFGKLGITDRDERLGVVAGIVGRPIDTSNDLSKQEAGMVIDALEKRLEQIRQAQEVPA